mmetsp:Transcript_77210/g.213498  ORF Transcript_77210/g.213498 Transcript_77210/m.213498 type:complete len:560 (-) Transcript_77210:192-1871(-)
MFLGRQAAAGHSKSRGPFAVTLPPEQDPALAAAPPRRRSGRQAPLHPAPRSGPCNRSSPAPPSSPIGSARATPRQRAGSGRGSAARGSPRRPCGAAPLRALRGARPRGAVHRHGPPRAEPLCHGAGRGPHGGPVPGLGQGSAGDGQVQPLRAQRREDRSEVQAPVPELRGPQQRHHAVQALGPGLHGLLAWRPAEHQPAGAHGEAPPRRVVGLEDAPGQALRDGEAARLALEPDGPLGGGQLQAGEEKQLVGLLDVLALVQLLGAREGGLQRPEQSSVLVGTGHELVEGGACQGAKIQRRTLHPLHLLLHVAQALLADKALGHPRSARLGHGAPSNGLVKLRLDLVLLAREFYDKALAQVLQCRDTAQRLQSPHQSLACRGLAAYSRGQAKVSRDSRQLRGRNYAATGLAGVEQHEAIRPPALLDLAVPMVDQLQGQRAPRYARQHGHGRLAQQVSGQLRLQVVPAAECEDQDFSTEAGNRYAGSIVFLHNSQGPIGFNITYGFGAVLPAVELRHRLNHDFRCRARAFEEDAAPGELHAPVPVRRCGGLVVLVCVLTDQ